MEKQTLATVVSTDAKGDEPTIVISTIALDRDRDEVVPEGGDLRDYLRNPVVLYGHATDRLPVGKTTSLEVVPGRGIRARWRWLEGDAFADRVRNAFNQGVLRAASIGFLPVVGEPNGKGGKRFTQWHLIEWSLVATPANPGAVRVLRSLDLWQDDSRTLEIADDVYSFEQIATAHRDAMAQARRQLASVPPFDPAARHRGLIDVDPAAVQREIVRMLPSLLRETVAEETAAAMRRARGLVD